MRWWHAERGIVSTGANWTQERALAIVIYMASNAPIAQHNWELVPPASIYTGEFPSFAGVTQVIDKEYSWIGFENVLRMYPDSAKYFDYSTSILV